MSEQLRVPMPHKAAFVGVGDVAVSAQPYSEMAVGRRFNFDVSEEVLAKMGGEALAHAVVRMGEAIAWSQRPAIEKQVGERLMRDPAYMAPIIERAFTESVNELIRERMAAWTDSMMRDAIRQAVREALHHGLYGDES